MPDLSSLASKTGEVRPVFRWCLQSPFLSFSQQGQDMFLDRVIFKSRVRNGFFIEAGADDLLKDSNTLFFELERDWTGILVEPVLWEKR